LSNKQRWDDLCKLYFFVFIAHRKSNSSLYRDLIAILFMFSNCNYNCSNYIYVSNYFFSDTMIKSEEDVQMDKSMFCFRLTFWFSVNFCSIEGLLKVKFIFALCMIQELIRFSRVDFSAFKPALVFPVHISSSNVETEYFIRLNVLRYLPKSCCRTHRIEIRYSSTTF